MTTVCKKKILICIFFSLQVFTVVVQDAGQKPVSIVRMIHRSLVSLPVDTELMINCLDSLFAKYTEG